MTRPATYGVTARHEAPDAQARALEELERVGFTILGEAVPAADIAAMQGALDRVLAAQAERIGLSGMRALGDSGTARALLDEDDAFMAVLRAPLLAGILDTLLGPAAIVLQQNGIVVPPAAGEHHQQTWHRDLPYQHWVATRPIAISALLPLDPFTAETGATCFLPGSHRHAAFPSDGFVARWEHGVVAEPGAIVLFDAMTYHRAGTNRSPGPRRAVNTVFGVPLLAQQVAFRDRPDLEPTLRRRLGVDYHPAADADAWRRLRLARIGPGR